MPGITGAEVRDRVDEPLGAIEHALRAGPVRPAPGTVVLDGRPIEE